jgi:hypothetical protein
VAGGRILLFDDWAAKIAGLPVRARVNSNWWIDCRLGLLFNPAEARIGYFRRWMMPPPRHPAIDSCSELASKIPSLLLLDEPTAGVDPKARRDFWDELQGLAARGISVLVSTHYMDEAVRCHKLAYIAYGELLAQGSAAEIIASQGLSTWAIHGARLAELQQNLRRQSGVDQTVTFGDVLHVSGTDGGKLQHLVETTVTGKALRAERIDTTVWSGNSGIEIS